MIRSRSCASTLSPICTAVALGLLACGGTSVGDGTGTSPGTSIPAGAKRVFVTSTSYSGDFRKELASATAPAGTDAADALCQMSAEAAGLGSTWTAYLFAQGTFANDRITGTGPWYGTDGQLVFNSKANLVTAPASPLVYNERGQRLYSAQAWIGSAEETCANWTTNQYSSYAAISSTGGLRQESRQGCHLRANLYCFEN